LKKKELAADWDKDIKAKGLGGSVSSDGAKITRSDIALLQHISKSMQDKVKFTLEPKIPILELGEEGAGMELQNLNEGLSRAIYLITSLFSVAVSRTVLTYLR
jgi:hypothetical protein